VFEQKPAGGTCINGMRKRRKKHDWGAANSWVAFLEDQKPSKHPQNYAEFWYLKKSPPVALVLTV
jgi:hypothetical protein